MCVCVCVGVCGCVWECVCGRCEWSVHVSVCSVCGVGGGAWYMCKVCVPIHVQH